MAPKFDIFRIEKDGPKWIEPAATLDDAKTRIQQRGAREPGEYFVFDHDNREKIPMKVQAS